MFITCFSASVQLTDSCFLSFLWVHVSLLIVLPSLRLHSLHFMSIFGTFLVRRSIKRIIGELILMLLSFSSYSPLQLKSGGSCQISRILTEANTSNVFTNLRSWYPANTTCSYRLSVPEIGDRISLHFLWFRIDKISFCAESLRIYDSVEPDRDKLMNKVCDTNKPMVSFPFFLKLSLHLIYICALLSKKTESFDMWGRQTSQLQPSQSSKAPSSFWLLVTHETEQITFMKSKLTVNLSTFLFLPLFFSVLLDVHHWSAMIGRCIQIYLYVNWSSPAYWVFFVDRITIWIFHQLWIRCPKSHWTGFLEDAKGLLTISHERRVGKQLFRD
jgi:hypothetical protein